jgi:site-specific recombinase XerD
VPARKPFPKLCYHKGTRRFFVDYQGSWRYWPTGTSKAIAQADYDAMRAAHEEGRPVQLPGAEQRSARTIDTLIQAYLAHCDVYYANSKPSVANIERALTPLHSRFGKRPMDTFGPRLLREVREDLIQSGFSRKVINARVQTIVRMFKWAVAEELVPATIYEALRAVEGLRIGRTSAPEGPGRRPVPWEHVEPILPHVAREVAAMLVIQAESGGRPGEIVQMRMSDLDRTSKVWTYKPRRHKTQHLGKTRLVPLFQPAQGALLPFLQRVPPLEPDDYVFSPQRAESARSQVRRQNRKTRVQPSQLAREALPLQERTRAPRDGYDVNTYARAVRRGIEAANAALLREQLATALVPLYAEQDRPRATRAVAALPIQFLRLLTSTEGKVIAAEEQRLRRMLRRGCKKHDAADEAIEALFVAGKDVLERSRPKLLPYWSP